MNFKTVAEAFNYYVSKEVTEIEARAQEIGSIIDRDATADIQALNIELEGLKQAKANIMEKRSQQPAFNPITGVNFQQKQMPDDVLGSQEYRSAFFKSLLGKSLDLFEQKVFDAGMKEAEKRSNQFDTMTNATAVLPTATLNEVVSKARTMGGLIGVCRAFNIPSKVSVPVATPQGNASWHTEGQAVESQRANTANVSFTGYEILKVMSMSVATRKMSIQAFEAYIVEELTASVMGTINDALVNGTGTNQGKGILNGIEWTKDTNHFEYNKANGMTFNDVVKAPATLKQGYASGAVWAMNTATLYNQIYGLVDSTGRPIFLQDAKVDGIGKILGFPVVVDDNIPTDTILFGNFKYMGYNIPEGIMIEASRESSFRSGLIDYRALAIADCKPIVEEAFIKFTRAEA